MFDQGWVSPRKSRGDKRNSLGSGDVLGAAPRPFGAFLGIALSFLP